MVTVCNDRPLEIALALAGRIRVRWIISKVPQIFAPASKFARAEFGLCSASTITRRGEPQLTARMLVAKAAPAMRIAIHTK